MRFGHFANVISLEVDNGAVVFPVFKATLAWQRVCFSFSKEPTNSKSKILAIFSNLVHFSLLLGGIQPVSYEVPSPCHVR